MPTLLLVDDSPPNLRMLARRLEREGFGLLLAEDGQAAVDGARAHRPDLILMDLSLPILDGWEATQILKADPKTRSIPIVALTAHALSDERERAMKAGCDGYETKPIDLPRLLSTIDALLAQVACPPAEIADENPQGVNRPGPVESLSLSNPATGASSPSGSTMLDGVAPEERQAPLTESLSAPGEGVTAEPAPGVHRGRILVVDDVAANRDMLCRRLRRERFDAVPADGGTAALNLLAAGEYDAVLLDIMMPNVSGYDVLRTIRAVNSPAELPVIMATAKDQSADIVKALEMGASDYVTRPFDFPVVVARLSTQLALRRAVRQIGRLEEDVRRQNDALKLANATLRDDLEAAARVQLALLPAAPPATPGLRFDWLFKPTATLAGDILNIFLLGPDHVGFYVLDVSGHGVAAALLAVSISKFLSPSPDPSSLLWESNDIGASRPGYRVSAPAWVASRLAERFPFNESTRQYFTLLYAVVDLRTFQMSYVSAGHPGFLRFSTSGPPQHITTHGSPLGIPQSLVSEPPREQALILSPGERIFLFSDGLPDTVNTDRTPFGLQRMTEVLGSYGERPLSLALQGLWNTVEAWSAPASPLDDISVLALERA